MSEFEKFKKELLSKENFYCSLTDRKVCDKEYEHSFNDLNKFEMKTRKDYHKFYSKCNALSLTDKFRKIA